MAKTCFFTGKGHAYGNQKTYRGKAKYLGGVGKKITGISRRKFKANLQSVRCMVDGVIVRVWASTQAIKSGLVVKPIRREPFSSVNV